MNRLLTLAVPAGVALLLLLTTPAASASSSFGFSRGFDAFDDLGRFDSFGRDSLIDDFRFSRIGGLGGFGHGFGHGFGFGGGGTRVDERVDRDSRYDQRVDYDEDTVLLGIALANNGANIDPNDLRDIDVFRRDRVDVDRDVRLGEETVLSSLLLGRGAGGLGGLGILGSSTGSLGVLDVGDERVRADQDVRVRQRVDLDEDNVLLAIALQNAIGGHLDLADVADIRQDVRQDVRLDRRFDLDRDDALLALLLR